MESDGNAWQTGQRWSHGIMLDDIRTHIVSIIGCYLYAL